MGQFKHIERIIHRNPDIYEYIFKDKTVDAINEYVEAMLLMAQDVKDRGKLDQPLYIIVDVAESGLYSLRYALTRIKENLIPKVNYLPSIYFVYITDDLSDRMLIEQFKYMDNTRAKDSRKVFGTNERDKAITWLLSNK